MFAAGIAASADLRVDATVLLLAVLIAGLAALLRPGSLFATVLISISFLIAGSLAFELQVNSIAEDRVRNIYDSGTISSGDPVEVVGTIRGSVDPAVDGFFFRVEVESIASRQVTRPASGTVRLFAVSTSPDMAVDYARLALRPGSRIRVTTALNREDGFRNPGGTSRKTILEWQDLDATGTIKSPLLVEKLDQSGKAMSDPVFRLRDTLTDRFRELFSPQVAGVMIASLLGNRNFLDKQTADLFREGGTFHILVISGLHITFIGGLAALFVGLFTRRRWLQFLGAGGFLWVYTLAVGAEVPVIRASLMFTVLWFSYVIHRTGSLANALGACGLILLTWRPGDLFTPSFQLTFVSVSAIVLAGIPLVGKLRSIGEWTPTAAQPFPANVPGWLSRFCQTLYWDPRRWELEAARNVWSANLFKSPIYSLRRTIRKGVAYVFEGVIISLIVQAAMLPLVVYYFHRVTPISILLNLWTGILIALEAFVTGAAVIASFLSSSLALPFIRLAEMLHWFLVSVPGVLSHVPWLSFRVPVYAGNEIWLYGSYFLFAIILTIASFAWDPFALSKRASLPIIVSFSAICLLFVAGVIIFHPSSVGQPDGRLHVEFLDVGQGDSAFITFPNGETMLVDGGGRTSYRDPDETPFEPDVPSIGETVVSEFLWEKGYSTIGYVVGTHADADHIQGLSDVAENFRIGRAWFGDPQPDDADQVRLEGVLQRYGVPIERMTRDDVFEIGGVFIEILGPPPGKIGAWTENDRSLVLRLTYGSRKFLLTGDLERQAESEIANSVHKTDVVKVPHHGSRTSSTASFVAATQPAYAVIPVGRSSRFGHPHPDVVDRWKAAGARVLTTGREGTVSFSTDGNDLVVWSFVRDLE